MTSGRPSALPRFWIQPPPHTQAATGKYTNVAHTPEKSTHEPSPTRSAIAPEISAVVIIANTAPKPTPMKLAGSVLIKPKSLKGLPANPLSPSAK